MHMNVGLTVDRLSWEAIYVPEFDRIGVRVEQVVQPEPELPSITPQVMNIRIPLAVTWSADRIVGGEWIRPEQPVLQVGIPGSSRLDIDIERSGVCRSMAICTMAINLRPSLAASSSVT